SFARGSQVRQSRLKRPGLAVKGKRSADRKSMTCPRAPEALCCTFILTGCLVRECRLRLHPLNLNRLAPAQESRCALLADGALAGGRPCRFGSLYVPYSGAQQIMSSRLPDTAIATSGADGAATQPLPNSRKV